MSNAILDGLRSVTAGWARTKKSRANGTSTTQESDSSGRVMQIKEAAFTVLPQAYLKASANGTLPAHARQLMYAARPMVMKLTGGKCWRSSDYFTQHILSEYMEQRGRNSLSDIVGDLSGDEEWNIVFDARGHLHEPHTGRAIPLGTLQVKDYLASISSGMPAGVSSFNLNNRLVDTCGPIRRYAGVLFIEKEGFMPLLAVAQIAQKYDLAIMSTKGMSVVAARRLIDRVCGGYNIPLLVLHDFDKSGFSILATLQNSTRRYQFRNEITVIDLGLRLKDVEAYGLDSEAVDYNKAEDPASNLRLNGATESEVEFLCGEQDSDGKWHGKRVELNAFTSDKFIEWLEAKLDESGIEKVLPDDATLENTFKRAVGIEFINDQAAALCAAAAAHSRSITSPADLTALVSALLDQNPALPWDTAVGMIAAEAFKADAGAGTCGARESGSNNSNISKGV